MVSWKVRFLKDFHKLISKFFKDFIHLPLERGWGARRVGEKPACVRHRVIGFVSHACTPGMCPDWELDQ